MDLRLSGNRTWRRVRSLVAAVSAAAVFALLASRPLTAQPSQALQELLAGHGHGPVQLHTTDMAASAGADSARLGRIRRVPVASAPRQALCGGTPSRHRRRPLTVASAFHAGRPLTVAGSRRMRRWPRRLLTLTAVVAGMLLIPATVLAAPIVPPPSPSPTPSSSAPAQGPEIGPCGGGVLPADQQRWCFGWAQYTATPPTNPVSHWVTNCSLTKSTDELAACQAVSFEPVTNPKDGARATLADVPVGTAPVKDMVGCQQFARAAAAVPDPTGGGRFEVNIWTAKAARCDVIADALLPALGAAVAPPPPKADQQCAPLDQQCKIDKAVAGAVQHGVDAGIQGLISLVVQGVAALLSKLAGVIFTQTSIGAPDDAFYLVYNTTAGIMLIFVFALFIVSAVINTLRVNGPGPLASVGGLIRAVIGITFAGGIAWLLVGVWDEATNALLTQNENTSWDASRWITALTNVSDGAGTGALALVIGLFALIGLLLLFIIMLFRGMLTTGAALFGAVAMAGQASHETRSWGRRWFWTVNALAMSKFAIAALWIYGTRAAYGSDDVTTILQAVLIIWLMVFAPGILLRLTAIWDGYLADVNGRGFGTAAAAGAGNLLGRGADKLMDKVNGGGNGGDAADVMADNVEEMDGGATPGLDDGPAADMADEVETNEAGEDDGEVDGKGGPAAGEADGTDDGGSPNADEAESIDDNAGGARKDVDAAADGASGATGEQAGKPDGGTGSGVSVPADPTGESGTPQDADEQNDADTGMAAPPGSGSSDPDGSSTEPSSASPDALDVPDPGGADTATPGGGSSASAGGSGAAGADGAAAAAAV